MIGYGMLVTPIIKARGGNEMSEKTELLPIWISMKLPRIKCGNKECRAEFAIVFAMCNNSVLQENVYYCPYCGVKQKRRKKYRKGKEV